ncbi:DNA-binding response regulator [Arenicella chitinivorans]|uniref:DNA-binding response regulator n=1 Tax=Arenicella chitinivorans TaxID=1329800 RepID=A0A918RKE7_9GAMM|nr:response regulator transcription factor [Arenicella chitinivorans]GGZ99866.1 DNA-binding response regulator [Arenicella chitinivorans]
MPSRTTKILIIDDHQLVADGLAMILSRVSDHVTISTSYNVRSVLADEPLVRRQDLILVDLHMPTIDGFSFLQALDHRKITVPTVVISGVEDRRDIRRALELGACGFIPKELPSAQMLYGLRRVLSGQRYVPEHLAEFFQLDCMEKHRAANHLESNAPAGQSVPHIRERQLDVLELMHEGHSNIDIANILGISESTVKSHVSTLFRAFGVTNRTACVRAGLASNLIRT